MKITRRHVVLIFLLLLFAALVAVFEVRFNPTSLIYYTAGWVLSVLLLLWLGNKLITRFLNKYLSWLAYGNIRFFTHLGLGILYSLLVVNGSYAALKFLLTIDPPTRGQIIVMNVYGAVVFIPIFSVYFSLHFLRSWRRSEVESEKFQKESIRSQLESLKSHLDPHFLFNSLNILSSLIETDREKSKIFLDKFAEVYRLMLRSKSEDLITVREELTFIESYCFLLETRFSGSISFSIAVPDILHGRMLPPLTLQMLVENAIKHNVVTERKPLHISIAAAGENLVVSNSMNERPAQKENAAPGSGLRNIRMRYGHFTRREISIAKTETDFIVTIPLIENVAV